MTSSQTIIPVMMPRPRWTLLNLIYRRMEAGGVTKAIDLMWISDTDDMDLVDLAAGGLIRGRSRDDGEPFDLTTVRQWDTGGPRARLLADLDLLLTRAGCRWLDTDPHNKVLWAAHTYPGPRSLCRLARARDLDPDAVLDCAQRGLVALTYLGSGRPVDLTTRTVCDAIRTGDESILLGSTTTGASIVYPT